LLYKATALDESVNSPAGQPINKGDGLSSGGKDSKKSNSAQEKREKKQKINTSDPIDAIRRSADDFKDGQVNNPAVHSAKEVYNERLNRVETVFSEAYQDALVSLKTAQNAIAKDNDIPDSQNAYMAENLMHGKTKNEQDLYNIMYRDPLIRTINKIMNSTGMNWGDIDRYVYTKSGLERNREFFVRDYAEEGQMADWNDWKDAAYGELEAGTITFPEYLARLDEFIRKEIDKDYKPSEHDYSGFRAMYGDENGVYDEGDIVAEMMATFYSFIP